MKVAAYQMPVTDCYGSDAVEHLAVRVRECEGLGVQLLCCPEAAVGGLADYVEAPEAIAISADRITIEAKLRPLASRTVTVIVGFTERGDFGDYYNAAAVCSGGSVQGIYRKRHPAIRQSRYRAGTEAPVFDVDGLAFGILICRDSTDAQLAKTLVDDGARVLFVPTNNAMPPDRYGPGFVDEVHAVDEALAMTLGVPVVRADVIGSFGPLVGMGTSVITVPSATQVRPHGNASGELIISQLGCAPRLQ